MRSVFGAMGGVLLAAAVLVAAMEGYEKAYVPSAEVGEMPFIEQNQAWVTVNTTRIGSDDPVETAVGVSQVIYPVTEEENAPGAVILVNRNSLAEVLVAASRVQHFPVNAPLLYVDGNQIPELTRQELLRLQPEGVPVDGNVQVYLVGAIGDEVRREVEGLGFKTRSLRADDPIELAVIADDWSGTQHGDHRNEVAIANLDHLETAIPSAFWNAHRGDGLGYVTDQGVPEETREMLQRRANGPWIYLFGDESVISTEIARELAQYGHVTRVPGSSPAEVSASFAGFHDEGADWGAWFWMAARDFGWGIDEAGHNAIFVNLDGPGGWQNALPATTLSHMGKHAPVLILENGELTPPVVEYLEATRPYETAPRQQLLNHGWIIGDETTIRWETQAEINRMLEAYPLAPEGGEE